MNISYAKELFRTITKEHFGNTTTVIFANQSRQPKPNIPLVTIALGTPGRPLSAPVAEEEDGLVSNYPTSVKMVVDLFTNGKDVLDGTTVIGHEDTSVDEMYAFKDFLESEYTIEWCHANDVAIGFDGDVVPMTGIVNDSTYEFRSRLTVIFYFTHRTVGKKSGPWADEDGK